MDNSNRRYETDPQKHIARCNEWLLNHNLKHKFLKDNERCADCDVAERIADGVAHLRDAIQSIEWVENEAEKSLAGATKQIMDLSFKLVEVKSDLESEQKKAHELLDVATIMYHRPSWPEVHDASIKLKRYQEQDKKP